MIGRKERKPLKKVRREGKRNYTAEQRAARRKQTDAYKLQDRPSFLLELAVLQGRLSSQKLSELLVTFKGQPREVLRSLDYSHHPLCEVCGEKVAEQCHHRKGRGNRRTTGELSLLNDKTLFLGVCRDCHERIERNPKWAIQMGYSLPRNHQEGKTK